MLRKLQAFHSGKTKFSQETSRQRAELDTLKHYRLDEEREKERRRIQKLQEEEVERERKEHVDRQQRLRDTHEEEVRHLLFDKAHFSERHISVKAESSLH